MLWKRITLVGVGLLGGSLGLAIKQRRLAGFVAGYVRRPTTAMECERLGAVDMGTCVLQSAVEESDLVVLCTPISQMRPLTEKMLPWLKAGAVVTDVGSVKASVVQELEPLVDKAGAYFVGSHPMAGAEKTGVAAARAELFRNAVCVITPNRWSNKAAVRTVQMLWKSVGGRPLKLTPEKHDRLVSRSSHLPHVIAAELANFVLSPGHSKDQAALCANGFRDTTRIASGSIEMWRDIALANRENLSYALGDFITELHGFRRALDDGNLRKITKFFEKAKERRDLWTRETRSASPE